MFEGLLNGSCFSVYNANLDFNVFWSCFWITELLRSAYAYQLPIFLIGKDPSGKCLSYGLSFLVVTAVYNK